MLFRSGEIFLGQSDLFNCMAGFKTVEEKNEILNIEKSEFCTATNGLNEMLAKEIVRVTKIDANELGDLTVHMEEGYRLEIFVDACGNKESWRFFDMNNESAHFVVFDEEDDATC